MLVVIGHECPGSCLSRDRTFVDHGEMDIARGLPFDLCAIEKHAKRSALYEFDLMLCE